MHCSPSQASKQAKLDGLPAVANLAVTQSNIFSFTCVVFVFHHTFMDERFASEGFMKPMIMRKSRKTWVISEVATVAEMTKISIM